MAKYLIEETVFTIGSAFVAGGFPLALKYTPLMTFTEAVDLFKKAANAAYRPPDN